MINWIKTYEFLGYPPSDNLETEIYNKAIDVKTGWKKGMPKNPNEYHKKFELYVTPEELNRLRISI